MSLFERVLNLSKGNQFPSKITTYKTNEIIIEVNENSLPYIQADGELIGKGGMRVSIIPKALSFYSP